MSATLKDVAELAQVSTATVSYVLNDGPRTVRPATRQRVLDAIEQLGYRPRQRRQQTSPTGSLTIGVLVPSTYSKFFGDAIEGIETFLYGRGHSCIVASSWEDPDIERQLLRKFGKLVDGLIITPVVGLTPRMERLYDQGIPIVIMDRLEPGTAFDGVTIDNYSITAQAVRLLFESNSESIALVSGPEELSPIQQRLAGYKDTLNDLGLAYTSEWVAHVPFSQEDGRNAALDLMSLHSPPDALICTGGDTITIGVLHGLNQLGFTVPDNVALVSYGDTSWNELLSPALTVIDAPTFLMGETSARLLLQHFSDSVRTKPRHIVLETKPILRESHRKPRDTVK